jgi:hypothetical protein
MLMRAWYKLDLDRRGRWFADSDETWDEWERLDWRGLVASFQYATARESFERVRQWYERGDPIASIIAGISAVNPAWVRLKNGAIINWGSLDEGGKHVEAVRRRRIKVDEVGLIPDMRTVHGNILNPRTLGVSGAHDWYGTPKPKTDEFVFEMFEDGQEEHPRVYSQTGDARENPFWPQSDRDRVMADPDLVRPDGEFTPLGRQVILGEFAQSGRKWFLRTAVRQMFKSDHTWYVPQPLVRRHSGGRGDTVRPLVFQAWDLGGSSPNSDATVGITGVVYPNRLPYLVADLVYLEGGEASWEKKYKIIEQRWRTHRPLVVGVDVTGPAGDAVQEELERRGLPIEPYHFGGTAAKKHDLVRGLQSDMEARWTYWEHEHLDGTGPIVQKAVIGRWRWPDPVNYPLLIDRRSEFYRYRYPDDKKLKQDTVMAMCILADLVRENAPRPTAEVVGPADPTDLESLEQATTPGFADINI